MTVTATAVSSFLSFASACIERVGAESPASIVASDPNLLLSIAELVYEVDPFIYTFAGECGPITRVDVSSGEKTDVSMSSLPHDMYCTALCHVGGDLYLLRDDIPSTIYRLQGDAIALPPHGICATERLNANVRKLIHYDDKIEYITSGYVRDGLLGFFSCVYDLGRGTWREPELIALPTSRAKPSFDAAPSKECANWIVAASKEYIVYSAGDVPAAEESIIARFGKRSRTTLFVKRRGRGDDQWTFAYTSWRHHLIVVIIGEEIWFVDVKGGDLFLDSFSSEDEARFADHSLCARVQPRSDNKVVTHTIRRFRPSEKKIERMHTFSMPRDGFTCGEAVGKKIVLYGRCDQRCQSYYVFDTEEMVGCLVDAAVV